MSGIHTTVVTRDHPYTSSDEPWRLDRHQKRLFHYLSGGGMRTFGRTVGQEIRDRRRNRFYIFAAVFFAVWTLLLVW